MTSTLVELPGGRLELLGLDRWTAAAIQDSLDQKAPGASIASPDARAALRDVLHFPEAMGSVFSGADTANSVVIVAVIEPQNSSWVRHRLLPLDTVPAHRQAPWTALVDLTAQRPELVHEIVLSRLRGKIRHRPPEVPPSLWADSTLFRSIWGELDSRQQPRDLAESARILATAPYLFDRAAALVVLANFVGADAAWQALTGAQLEPDGRVRSEAILLLAFLTDSAARPVDWSPAAEDLHAILDGSALDGLTGVMKMLVATKVDPGLAGALLKGGGHGVLMYAGAQHPAFREPALAFLRHMSGKDFGKDLDRWQAWIDGL